MKAPRLCLRSEPHYVVSRDYNNLSLDVGMTAKAHVKSWHMTLVAIDVVSWRQ
jgi:hypothetical protein